MPRDRHPAGLIRSAFRVASLATHTPIERRIVGFPHPVGIDLPMPRRRRRAILEGRLYLQLHA
jgi:hypothetical protein